MKKNIPYSAFENEVYRWMKSKHDTNPNFRFSTRVTARKGLEKDYFAGTEQSGYFTTTFWDIPVQYPGAAVELISLNFSYLNDGKIYYYFRLNVPPTVEGEQNLLAQQFAKQLNEELQKEYENSYFNKTRVKGRIDTHIIPETKGFEKVNDLLKNLEEYIETFIAFVDKRVDHFKNNNPSIIAGKINEEKFRKYENHLARRLENQLDNKSTKEEVQSINTIIFGPPGTGKTHSTIEKAIEIVDPKFFKENKEDWSSLKRRFNELLIKDDTKGQIMFCTFHQSFSYEDFVEGIKPQEPGEDDNFLKYKVEDGVFKKICRIAESQTNVKNITSKNLFNFTEKLFKQTIFYKLSLGDSTKEEDQEIYEYCISNNMIAIGFAGQIDFSGKSESEVNSIIEEEKIETFAAQAINYFKNYLKIGNYVIISNGNSFIRAIAKVTGDYEYHSDLEIKYKHLRKVEWVFKDVEIPVSEFYEKNLSQQTIYKLKGDFIKPEFFVKEAIVDTEENNEKNFVLIIDEINRGNVSAIFGELITLIEDSKRAGKDEELEVVLPYSKKPFKVPDNLFIIGTMNTADRSVEALDTALRRRFTFKEMSPDYSIIEKLSGENGVLEGVNLVKLLNKMNSRLEILLDKDHKIGHSYFLGLKNILELKFAFRNKIIPLFEEYFFGDFGKIGLVLGSSFVQKKNKETVSFAKFEDYDPYLSEDLLQKDIFIITDENNWDFKSIYE